MIAKARWLLRAAEPAELFWFVLMSGFTVVIFGTSMSALATVLPEVVGSEPEFSEAYLSRVVPVVAWVVFLVFGFFTAIENYRILQNTIARCELAEDELSWVKKCPEYERMVEDRELMRLSANVRRVCRTYRRAHPLLMRFLRAYRALLENYSRATEEEYSSLIEEMNEAAEEGLEQHETRVRRERRKKNREGRGES